MQDRGFNSFTSNMIKLSLSETKWSSLLSRTGALILFILIWIFEFGPEKVTRTFKKRATALVILFSTGWDLLSVMHRGWALLDSATGVLVGLHCWEWLTLYWLKSMEFLWRGCQIRGLQGYRSLSRLWAVEWLSAPAENSSIFCLYVIGSHIC